MSTHPYLDRVAAAVTAAALLLTILFMNGEKLGLQLVVDADSQLHSDSVYFTDNDLDASWAEGDAVTITLTGDGAEIVGNGAYVLDGDVVIRSTGRYRISGSLDDGSIIVDAYDSSKVWIALDGTDISCSDGPAFYVRQADKVFLTLAAGTQNRLAGGDTLSDEALRDGAYGTVFSHDDLTINGTGTLTVEAGFRHGIKANDDLVVTGGTLIIDAAVDGIHVNDSFRLCDASLSITCDDDGVVTEKENSWFYMESGSLLITAQGDALNSAGTITLAGGSITIDAGDDAVHADESVEILSGEILANSCYEGIEAPKITVLGGDITIYPTDDGFNANGGSSFGGMMPFGGEQRPGGFGAAEETTAAAETDEAADAEESLLRIEGGTITIINDSARDADGLDSNGSIRITGGDIRISLTGSSSNSAIDYGSENGGTCEITGGTVIACGSYSMAESFDSSSSQCSFLYTISDGAEAGSLLELSDAAGNSLLSWEVPCSFTSANISCPGLNIGDTYTLRIGEDSEEITLTETSSAFGDAQSSMFGNTMNWGGMRRQGRNSGMRRDQGEDTVSGNDDGTGFPGMGTPPGMPESMEIPEGMTPPDGADGGSGNDDGTGFPAMGMPPGMPEGMEIPEGMTPPDSVDGVSGNDQATGFSGMGTPSEGRHGGMERPQQGAEPEAAESQDAVDESIVQVPRALADFSRETYLQLSACAAVLAAGLLAAISFRRHR